MRNRCVPFVLLLLIGFTHTETEAQNPWPMADSEWNYTYYSNWPPPGNYLKFSVNGVDTVEGIACTRIMQEEIEYNMFYTPAFQLRLIHFDGDTLWHFVEADSSFYPLICFNALPGDSWHPLPFDSLSVDTTCTVTPIIVADTFSIVYNGQSYRGITIESTDGQSHLHWYGSFDERTFKNPNTSELGWLFPFYNFGCDGTIIEWFFHHLLCYNDAEIDLVLDDIASITGESNCEYPWNTVYVNSPLSSTPVKAYPNPSTGLVSIDLGQKMESLSLKTYDATGRLISTQSLNGVAVFDYNLPEQAGIYLIRLTDESGQTNHLRLVKR